MNFITRKNHKAFWLLIFFHLTIITTCHLQYNRNYENPFNNNSYKYEMNDDFVNNINFQNLQKQQQQQYDNNNLNSELLIPMRLTRNFINLKKDTSSSSELLNFNFHTTKIKRNLSMENITQNAKRIISLQEQQQQLNKINSNRIRRNLNTSTTNIISNDLKFETKRITTLIPSSLSSVSTNTTNTAIIIPQPPTTTTTTTPIPYYDMALSENHNNSNQHHHHHHHQQHQHHHHFGEGVNLTITPSPSPSPPTTTITITDTIETINLNDNNNNTKPICYHEDDYLHGNCILSENETCFGDPEYCNYTYDEYLTIVHQYMFPTTSEWILICSHIVVFIMGLVGNALVCIAVYTNYSMRTVTNVFIVNLAIADFFVILVCLPPSVVWDVTETWFMGEIMCKIVGYIQVVSVTVSVLTLTFISIDRWYAICFPLRYRTKISRAIASVAFIWIFACLSSLPELLALTVKGPKLRFGIELFTQCLTKWDNRTEENVMIARFMLLYTLPLLLMTVAYFKIVRVLWKSDTIPGHRESRNHYQYTCAYSRGTCMPPANTSTMGQLRARRKAAKMLVAVVVMFAICYFPVHMLSIMRYQAGIQDEVKAVLALFSHWLCYANSAVNPVIYNFMSGKFRREFRNALEKCRCSRIRVEDRTLTHSTPASRMNNISPSIRSNYQLTSVRDITRDSSRQTVQTTFMENCGNGHTLINNHNQSQNNHHNHHNHNNHHIKSNGSNKIP